MTPMKQKIYTAITCCCILYFIFRVFELLTPGGYSGDGVFLPNSHALARASAFILLIMALIAGVAITGWGGGSGNGHLPMNKWRKK